MSTRRHVLIYSYFWRILFTVCRNNRKLTTGMTLAAMSGKRTLHEWRVRTNSCLYLSVSSCSVTLFVLITSFFKTITNWKTSRCHWICNLFSVFFPCVYARKTTTKTWIHCPCHPPLPRCEMRPGPVPAARSSSWLPGRGCWAHAGCPSQGPGLKSIGDN